MTDDRMNQMAADVSYTRGRIDDLHMALADHRVEMEKRVSRLEVKAGLWGVLGGVVSVVFLKLKGGQ